MPREKTQAATTARSKVPMRRRGADCLVLAMKRGNARGAKEVGHRHWIGSTSNGRSPITNGRRQPSCDGTSRMMREYQVRICERLRVKFPGPTRHFQTHAPQQMASSLDNLVGAREERRGHFEAERLGGLQIDEQLEIVGPIDRDVARLGPVEDLVHIDGKSFGK